MAQNMYLMFFHTVGEVAGANSGRTNTQGLSRTEEKVQPL